MCLPPSDSRAVHIRKVLKASPGQAVKVRRMCVYLSVPLPCISVTCDRMSAAHLPPASFAQTQVGIVNGPIASAVLQRVLDDGSVQLTISGWTAAADVDTELQVH